MNFFQQQHKARQQTKWLLLIFIVAVVAIIFLVNIAVYFAICLSAIYCTSFEYYWLSPWGISVTTITLLIISLTSLIRWGQLKKGGGFKVVLMVGARPVSLDTNRQEERRFINPQLSLAQFYVLSLMKADK